MTTAFFALVMALLIGFGAVGVLAVIAAYLLFGFIVAFCVWIVVVCVALLIASLANIPPRRRVVADPVEARDPVEPRQFREVEPRGA
jgi:hypothetical protein